MKKRPVVYLIHLDSPLCHARHYIGYSDYLEARLAHHENGTGSKFLRAVASIGIKFHAVALYVGADRHFERLLHNTHNTATYCPICAGAKVRTFRPSGYLVTEPKIRAYKDICQTRWEVANLHASSLKTWQYDRIPDSLGALLGE